jgi:hypothetical protein
VEDGSVAADRGDKRSFVVGEHRELAAETTDMVPKLTT